MDNIDVVRRIEEAWDSHDEDALDALIAPDFHAHTPGSDLMSPGLEGAKSAHQASMQAMPDRRNTVHDIFGEGDYVVSRVSMDATNTGGLPWVGVPANGNKIHDVGWITIYRLQDGKVVETWAQMEVPKMMQQLGAMPGPAEK
jgi:predicted ester cyclase